MRREKAIELLGYLDTDPELMKHPDYKDAVKLSIDATISLTLIQASLRQMGAMLLPGETERR